MVHFKEISHLCETKESEANPSVYLVCVDNKIDGKYDDVMVYL